jgi:hypothetical protein
MKMSKRMIPSVEEINRLHNEERISLKEICRMYGLSHNSSGNLSRLLKKNGYTVISQSGKDHHSWKGGRITKGDNYVGIWNPTHERADNQGYVYEHTLIIEKHLGRLPNKNEVIHHIDLDKKNNSIDNLYLCDSKKHISCHRTIEKMVKQLMDCGIVEFKDGEYGIVVDVFADIVKTMVE